MRLDTVLKNQMTKTDTYLKRELESVLQIYISTIDIGPSPHPTLHIHPHLWQLEGSKHNGLKG